MPRRNHSWAFIKLKRGN